MIKQEKFISSFKALSLSLLCLLLSGCYALNRLENVGDRPSITPIKDPTKLPNYHPVTMPMPEPKEHEHRVNSLWQDGARGFFKDQRAKRVGDILTVNVNITNDQAEFSSDTDRDRETTEKFSVNSFMGYEKDFAQVLPEAVIPKDLVGLSNKPTYKGGGKTKRSEKMSFKLAVTIVQILPNGNYVISGRQEMRVNFENREISLTGIVRASDITSANTVSYEKIAEARISYGGRGNIMDYQQPPIGSQIMTHISPY